MKNIWRISLMGYLFGMLALIVCVTAVVTDLVKDMGIALLVMPIACPVLLVLFWHLSKHVFSDVLYGQGALWRWTVMGVFAGLFITIRVMLAERAAYAEIYSIGMLFVFLLVFWLIFFMKRGRLNEIKDQES